MNHDTMNCAPCVVIIVLAVAAFPSFIMALFWGSAFLRMEREAVRRGYGTYVNGKKWRFEWFDKLPPFSAENTMISLSLGEGWRFIVHPGRPGEGCVMVISGPRGEGAAFTTDAGSVRAEVLQLFIDSHSPPSAASQRG